MEKDNTSFKTYKADSELKEALIQAITDSEKDFGTVMATIQTVRFHFISKAETFLKESAIKKVSDSSPTPYIEYLAEIMDSPADTRHEAPK